MIKFKPGDVNVGNVTLNGMPMYKVDGEELVTSELFPSSLTEVHFLHLDEDGLPIEFESLARREAEVGSKELLERLRRHHPERVGVLIGR